MRFPTAFLTAPVLFFSFAAAAAAQTPTAAKAPAAAGKDRYAAESFVIERSDWVYAENGDGTGYREHTVAVKLQSEAALRVFGVVSVPFASATEHVEFHYLRVRRADGSITETPASDAIEQPEPVTREAPFYSDLKDEQVPIKNLQVGDTLEWQARIVRTRGEAPGHFWGQEVWTDQDFVTLEEAIELRVPAASQATVWTNPHDAKPQESTEGAQKVYRWKSAQLTPTAGPEGEAAKKAKKAKLLSADEQTDADEGALPAVAWTNFKSWADVGAWYRGLEGHRAEPDDEIRAQVKDLTAKSATEEDKVRAVYGFVSARVRYVGVAFGVGRFQPHEAADVLHNQYGDCKDKATLLAAELEALGLHPDTVLIGQEIRFNEAVPSPAAFNHAITRVKLGDREVWLDATQEVGPYRVLLFPLRDKQALVVPESGPAVIERTPKDLPFPSVDTWKAVGTLNKDGISESHISMTFRGDNELLMRMAVHQFAPAQYDEIAQKFLNAIGYAGTTSHASFSRPEDTTDPFTFDVDYHREKAGDWDNLKTIPQLEPVSLPAVDEKDPPVGAFRIGTPLEQRSHAEMKLPAGWSAELPEAVHEKSRWATYDLTYKLDNGTLISDRLLVITQPKVAAADWKEYKKFTDAISLGYEPYVQLIRSGADGKPVATGSAHVSSEAAETLIKQAFDSTRSMDDKTAEALLKRARAIDPEARRLWAAYGWLALARGKPNEAIDDFRKELALYPNAFEEYEAILSAQRMRRDMPAAEQTLREWAAADPENPKPEEQLADLLMSDNKPGEAVDAAAKALTLLSPDATAEITAVKMTLGNAQLKSGAEDKGEATLVGVLNASEDPLMLNNAAYALADAKRQLPLADAKSKLALDKMTAETSSWTLNESPQLLAQKTSLLTAAWDTYGWILYREGKTAQAHSYILAAYRNSHHAEVRGHLDEVDAALGRPKETETGRSEQQSRTIPLGSWSGPKGVAEYRLLLAHGKVERVEPAGDKTIDGGAALIQTASFAEYFPDGSDARLVHSAMLNCVSGKCDLVLEP